MIRTFFLTIILLVQSFILAAQNADSLYSIIVQNNTDANTEQALILFGETIEDNYPDSALSYYKKAEILSAKTGSAENKMFYYRAKIYALTKKGIYNEALDLVNTFLQKAEQLKNKRYLANAYAAAGTFYGAISQNDLAIDFYKQSADLFSVLNDNIALAEIYVNISTVYADHGQYEQSIKYAEKCIAEKKTDTFRLVQAYTNMHHSYGWLKKPELEEKYMRACLAMAGLYNNNYIKMQTFGNTAHWFAENEKYDSAVLFADKEYSLAVIGKFYTVQSEAKAITAWAYTGKKEYAKATANLDEAKSVIREKKNIPLLHKQFLLDIEYNLLKAQGKYKEALLIKEKWAELNNIITSKATSAKLVFFDNEIKKKEIEKQMAEKEFKINRQKLLITTLAIGIVALLFTAVLLYLYQRKKQLAKSEMIKVMEKQQELVKIKSGLEGQLQERTRISKEIHDELGSSLTSITLLTEVLKKRLDMVQNPEVIKISETSSDMVDKMNEIIWALNTNNDTVESLIAYTRKFANNFLHQAGIKLEFDQTGFSESRHIEGTVRRNIYLTIKEALNNIVRHSGATHVTITVTDGQNLQIRISDNGRGIAPDQWQGTGNGITNMKKRMEEIGGGLFIETKDGLNLTLSCNL